MLQLNETSCNANTGMAFQVQRRMQSLLLHATFNPIIMHTILPTTMNWLLGIIRILTM